MTVQTNATLRQQLRSLIGMAGDLAGVLAAAEDLEPLIRTSAEHELAQLQARLESLADGVACVANPSWKVGA